MRRTLCFLVFCFFLFSFSACHSQKRGAKAHLPSFSVFYESTAQENVQKTFNYLTEMEGFSNNWGDGLFSYGLWEWGKLKEVEEAHFFNNEVKRKVFIVRNLKDLVVLQVLELERENTLDLSEEEYSVFKKLKTTQERIAWFLNGYSKLFIEGPLESLYHRIRLICHYQRRSDVLLIHAEDLSLEKNLRALAAFLNLPPPTDSEEKSPFFQENPLYPESQIGIWKKYFNPKLEALFYKKLGAYQFRLGYT